MGQRTVKKNRKEIRRAVNENFGEGMQALSNIVRVRPKWIPKQVWILLYMPLFKRKYIKVVYKYLQ